ncbi:MAG: cryptochrome/photolyase family protein [Desulfobacterales bacterium]
MPREKILRLILGDQLNENHSWFKQPSEQVTYVLMEIRQETDYVAHHIQKVAAFFAAMRTFAGRLRDLGHRVTYLKLDDPQNNQPALNSCCPTSIGWISSCAKWPKACRCPASSRIRSTF